MMVAVPQSFVVVGIAFKEFIEIGMDGFKHSMPVVQVQDAFAAVGFKIPDGMIEVEKEVFVFQGDLVDKLAGSTVTCRAGKSTAGCQLIILPGVEQAFQLVKSL